MRIHLTLTAALTLLLVSTQPAQAGFRATLKNYGTAGAFPGLIEQGEHVVRIDWTQSQLNSQGQAAPHVPWIAGDFFSFCIERTQDVYFGRTYDYTTQVLEKSPDPGTTGMGSAKANQIRRLWAIVINGDGDAGVNQLNPTDAATRNKRNAAFQQAIWFIVDESYRSNTKYTQSSVKSLVDDYVVKSKTPGKTANLVALTGKTFQDQVVEVGPGYYVDPNGTVVPTPVPPVLVLAVTGIVPLLGLCRYFRSGNLLSQAC